jgi:hypothetical protein
MLKSARISGRREHRGQIVADAEWAAIISPAESDRLRALFSDPSRRKNELARRYLLAGMLRCGRCGEPLISRPRDDGARRYVCAKRPGVKACGRIAVLSEEVEELEAALQAIEGPKLGEALAARSGDRADVHRAELEAAGERRDELTDLYTAGEISAAEWKRARPEILERIERAEAALSRSNGTGALAAYLGHGSALRDSWAALPLSRRRAILAAVLDQVTIGPARPGFNRFDPRRVELTWKV